MHNILILVLICNFWVFKIDGLPSVKHANHIKKSGSKFDISNIKSNPPYDSKFETQIPKEHIVFINDLLQRPFFWLAQGTQSYAFLSENKKYVLKIFKQKLSKPWRSIEQIQTGAKLGFEEINDESGIIFLHNIPMNYDLKNFSLYDDTGKHHLIESNSLSFLIQKKAEYINPTIKNLMKQGLLDQAKARLDQIFDLFLSVMKKNITDQDKNIISTKNIGFVETHAIYIDVGRFVKQPIENLYEVASDNFQNKLYPLYEWLQEHYPILASYFNERKNEILQTLRNT